MVIWKSREKPQWGHVLLGTLDTRNPDYPDWLQLPSSGTQKDPRESWVLTRAGHCNFYFPLPETHEYRKVQDPGRRQPGPHHGEDHQDLPFRATCAKTPQQPRQLQCWHCMKRTQFYTSLLEMIPEHRVRGNPRTPPTVAPKQTKSIYTR